MNVEEEKNALKKKDSVDYSQKNNQVDEVLDIQASNEDMGSDKKDMLNKLEHSQDIETRLRSNNKKNRQDTNPGVEGNIPMRVDDLNIREKSASKDMSGQGSSS